MKKIIKNKRGFTLVEVMLAVAIIALTIGVFFSLILVVMKSHVNVVTTNDCADFALLNAQAFENTIINAKQVGGKGDHYIAVGTGNKLCMDGSPLFDLDQYKVEPGPKDKWKMAFNYTLDENGLCEYTITLTDNGPSSIPGLNNYVYHYNGSVYIPHCEANAGSGDKLYFSNY